MRRTDFAFTTTTTPDELNDPADQPKKESDVRVITRAMYRLNGPGYLDPTRPSHIWAIAASAAPEPGTPNPVTSGDFDEEQPVWAPDGSMIYFRSDRTKEPYYLPDDSDLYAVPATGGEPVKIASIDGAIDRPAIAEVRLHRLHPADHAERLEEACKVGAAHRGTNPPAPFQQRPNDMATDKAGAAEHRHQTLVGELNRHFAKDLPGQHRAMHCRRAIS